MKKRFNLVILFVFALVQASSMFGVNNGDTPVTPHGTGTGTAGFAHWRYIQAGRRYSPWVVDGKRVFMKD